MDWRSGFFKNRGWLGLLQYNSSTGTISSAGTTISDVASYTTSDFKTDATIDLTVARNVEVSDTYADSDFQPSLWRIVPAATNKRKLVSPYIVFSTYALLIAAYPAASYPGLRAMITGWNNIILRSNGSRYVPLGGRAFIFRGDFGSLASPSLNSGGGTTYSFNTGTGTPTFPANLAAVGDVFNIRFRMQRHNANATINPARVTFGTAGTSSDGVTWSGTLAATDLLEVSGTYYISVKDNTHYTTNSSAVQSGTGGTGQLVDTTNNVDFTQPMILSFNGTKNTSDTIDLISYDFEWVAV